MNEADHSEHDPNDEPQAESPRRLHAFVSGKVQGVSFRWYTAQEARRLGIMGYARNLDDGRVEVQAEGSNEALEALLQFLHTGSPGSSVRRVSAQWLDAGEPFSDFEIR